MPVQPFKQQVLKPTTKLKRYFIWLLLVTLYFITYFHRVALNVTGDYLMLEFGLSGAGLGALAAVYAYMYLVLQIPGGMMVDRWGPRIISVVTGFSLGLGSLIFGCSASAAWLYVGRFFIGLGGSLVLINIFKFQALWFAEEEFAVLSGLATFIGGSGAILATSPLSTLTSVYGWRLIFWLMGLLALLASAACWLVIPPKGGGKKLTPQPHHDQKFAYSPINLIKKKSSLLPPFMISFGTYGSFITLTGTWGIPYLMHVHNYDLNQSASFMLAASLGYNLGAPFSGLVSRLLRQKRKPLFYCLGLYALLWLALVFLPPTLTTAGSYLFWFILGFSGGCAFLSFSYAQAVSLPGGTGIATAIVNSGSFLGMTILQPLYGFILDLNWQGTLINGSRVYPAHSYQYGFTLSFILALAAVAATFFMEEPDSAGEGLNKG